MLKMWLIMSHLVANTEAFKFAHFTEMTIASQSKEETLLYWKEFCAYSILNKRGNGPRIKSSGFFLKALLLVLWE